jgi:hypothetical protein
MQLDSRGTATPFIESGMEGGVQEGLDILEELARSLG